MAKNVDFKSIGAYLQWKMFVFAQMWQWNKTCLIVCDVRQTPVGRQGPRKRLQHLRARFIIGRIASKCFRHFSLRLLFVPNPRRLNRAPLSFANILDGLICNFSIDRRSNIWNIYLLEQTSSFVANLTMAQDKLEQKCSHKTYWQNDVCGLQWHLVLGCPSTVCLTCQPIRNAFARLWPQQKL